MQTFQSMNSTRILENSRNLTMSNPHLIKPQQLPEAAGSSSPSIRPLSFTPTFHTFHPCHTPAAALTQISKSKAMWNRSGGSNTTSSMCLN